MTISLPPRRLPARLLRPGQNRLRTARRRGRLRESAVRRLYYRDSYRRVHIDQGSPRAVLAFRRGSSSQH
jgi:hypothetical protein